MGRPKYSKDISIFGEDISQHRHRCPLCPKSFISASKLKRHSRVHTGEKPFECSVCFQRFPQKGGLKIHSVRHARQHIASMGDCNWSNEDCINGFTIKNLLDYRDGHMQQSRRHRAMKRLAKAKQTQKTAVPLSL